MRWAGHVACMGEQRKVYKVLVGKTEVKRPLGRTRCRWEDGIRMDLATRIKQHNGESPLRAYQTL
jgi:hypothetical protein